MIFPDHFSPVAAQYAASRPTYPPELFAHLAARAPARRLAWDAGCGNGQAAVGPAAHFALVVATDASAAQLASAPACANITWRVAAERDPLIGDRTVDLVTVAQAVHWFDREVFWAETNRVLAPGGVLAVWTYDLPTIAPTVDAIVADWYRQTLGAWWPAERVHVENAYRDIGFPFPPEAVPAFRMSLSWTRVQFVDYLRTWSAVTAFGNGTGGDALALIVPELEGAWPEAEVRDVVWPLTLLVGALSD
jgi:SAM-dependent methyltransferase